MTKLVLLVGLSIATSAASAKTVFESYYRIEKDRKHVGFVVQRLQEDPKTKVRTLKGYVQFRQGDKDARQEFALTSKAGQALKAEYRSNESGDSIALSAQFSAGGEGRVESRDRRRSTTKVGPVNVISGLLFYSADLARLKKDVSYTYQAYAEERGRVGRGSVVLMGKDDSVLQLADEFLGQTVENFVSPAGVPLGSRIDSQRLVTYWVPDRAAAIGLLDFPEASIKQMFGEIPKGGTHPWGQVPDARADVVIEKFAHPVFDRPVQPKSSQPLPMRNS